MDVTELKHGFLITNMAAAADGGSIALGCETPSHKTFDLLFTQNFFIEDYDEHMIPGRIYLNQELIQLKSKEEEHILKSLQYFKVDSALLQYDAELEQHLAEKFDQYNTFFSSNEALEFKKKVDNAR